LEQLLSRKSQPHRRVAILGLGTRIATDGLCSDLGAEAPSDAELNAAASLLIAKDRSVVPLDRASRLLLAAAAEALAAAQPLRRLAPKRCGVVVGTTKGAFELTQDPLERPAQILAQVIQARGPVLTVSAACASGAYALGQGLELLQSGSCDRVLVGGTESLLPFVFQGFHALKALSPSPAMPFDARRSGLSLGEGAAVLILEADAAAVATSARPIAWLEGFGASSDSHDQTAPDPRGAGLAVACARALEHAGAKAQDIDHYHAHGTATRHNDRMEAAVHAALFQGRPVPVTGIKGSIGHTLGAAGTLDALVCALSLARETIPPVVNLAEPDPAARVPAVGGSPIAHRSRRALVATAGFGGINGALVLSR
jgi:3-oxoacyl-[acyl-carrier-protein] synthase II